MPNPTLAVLAEIAQAEQWLREMRAEEELTTALTELQQRLLAEASEEEAMAAAWRWWLEEAPCSDSVN